MYGRHGRTMVVSQLSLFLPCVRTQTVFPPTESEAAAIAIASCAWPCWQRAAIQWEYPSGGGAKVIRALGE